MPIGIVKIPILVSLQKKEESKRRYDTDEKMGQGFSRVAVRPHFEPGTKDLSVPDYQARCEASALYSIDQTREPACLYLTDVQKIDQFVSSKVEKSVQFIRGLR